MRLLVTAVALVFVAASDARADLITPALALTALISSAFTTSAVVSAVGSFIIGSAISFGVSLVATAIRGSVDGSGDTARQQAATSSASAPNSPESRLSTRQATPPKRIIFGYAHVGGAYCVEKMTAPKLVRTYMLCAEEIDSVVKVFCGTQEIAFAALTPDTILTPLAQDGPNYHSNLRICIRLGKQDQAACPLVLANYPEKGANFRQRGIATVTVECDFGADEDEHRTLWGASGDPQFFFFVKGVKQFDPRDPLQLIDDPSTWRWSNNASVCQANYLVRAYGGRVGSKLLWDKAIPAFDYDDDLVACKDGSFIRRYTVDGMFLLNQRPIQVLQDMLTANRGTVAQTPLGMWPASSRPVDPVFTVYDRLVVGGIESRRDKPMREKLNKVLSRFFADEREYNQADGPPYVRADLLAIDGEALIGTVNFPFSRDHRRIQRLTKAFLLSSRKGKTISTLLDIRVFAEATDEVMNAAFVVNVDLFPRLGGIYRAAELMMSEDFSAVKVDGVEYDRSIETDWNCNTDEADFELSAP